MTAVAPPLRPLASVNRVEVGSYRCPPATYPTTKSDPNCSPMGIAQAWVTQFISTLTSGKLHSLDNLFTKESYWRDQLCLSWDFHTFHGAEKMIQFLEAGADELKIQSASIDTSAPHKLPATAAIDYHGNVPCVQFWINIETKLGRGVGVAKLVQDLEDGNRWKAYTLLTTLRELKGHEELTGRRRVKGVDHGGVLGRSNWQDRRNAALEFSEADPVVLIVGMYSSFRPLEY